MLNLHALASEVITDALVEKTLNAKSTSIQVSKPQIIEDDFVNATLGGSASKNDEAQKDLPITDSFAEKTIPENKCAVSVEKRVPIEDELAAKNLKNVKLEQKKKKNNLNFDLENQVPVKISINKYLTTRQYLEEGQELEFRVVGDVKISNNFVIKKDSVVKARLENISMNQAFGVPADMVIEKFVVNQPNGEKIYLDGSIKKIGANRSLWVYPVGGVAILFLFAGVLIFPIRGGHAKLRPKEVYEVYYVPAL